jgi:hypothetical protein
MEFDIVNVISQVGFPIAITIFSLVKLDKTIATNTKVLLSIAAKLDCDGILKGGADNVK